MFDQLKKMTGSTLNYQGPSPQTSGSNPFLVQQGNTANPFLKNNQPVVPQGPVAGPAQPVNTVTPVAKPLYVNGLTSDPNEMAKNRLNLERSVNALKFNTDPVFTLDNKSMTFDSNLTNTSSTRTDVSNLVRNLQKDYITGNNPELKPTSGYNKFIQDYSSAVKYTPEQQSAYEQLQKADADIQNITLNTKNRIAELYRDPKLTPGQARQQEIDITREADRRIADINYSKQSANLTFNALENARKNTLEAYQIQSPFFKPVEVSPGSQIIDPSTGQAITQGTGVSPSTAISYASQLYQNDLSLGQPKLTADGQIDNNYYYNQAVQQLSGAGGAGGSQSGTPSPMEIPSAIQSALNYVGDKSFIDMSLLNSNQLPMAQAYSAKTGIPILNKDDSTKIKDVVSTFNSTDSLINTIDSLSQKLLTATGPTGIPLQYAKTTLGSIFKTNDDAVVFDSSVKAFSSLLTRAAGEKGTLTDQDVARIISALPTKTDTISSAANKVQTLRDLYESVKSGAISSYIGGKTPKQSGAENIVQTKVGAINTNW